MNAPLGKVPYETQQAQYEINKMVATTFGTDTGKKCLEYMRQNNIGRPFENSCFVEQGMPYLVGRAAVNNFILDIYKKVERSQLGPPSPPEEKSNA